MNRCKALFAELRTAKLPIMGQFRVCPQWPSTAIHTKGRHGPATVRPIYPANEALVGFICRDLQPIASHTIAGSYPVGEGGSVILTDPATST